MSLISGKPHQNTQQKCITDLYVMLRVCVVCSKLMCHVYVQALHVHASKRNFGRGDDLNVCVCHTHTNVNITSESVCSCKIVCVCACVRTRSCMHVIAALCEFVRVCVLLMSRQRFAYATERFRTSLKVCVRLQVRACICICQPLTRLCILVRKYVCVCVCVLERHSHVSMSYRSD